MIMIIYTCDMKKINNKTDRMVRLKNHCIFQLNKTP